LIDLVRFSKADFIIMMQQLALLATNNAELPVYHTYDNNALIDLRLPKNLPCISLQHFSDA